MALSPDLLTILVCPACKGRPRLRRRRADAHLQRVPLPLPGRRRHSGDARRRGREVLTPASRPPLPSLALLWLAGLRPLWLAPAVARGAPATRRLVASGPSRSTVHGGSTRVASAERAARSPTRGGAAASSSVRLRARRRGRAGAPGRVMMVAVPPTGDGAGERGRGGERAHDGRAARAAARTIGARRPPLTHACESSRHSRNGASGDPRALLESIVAAQPAGGADRDPAGATTTRRRAVSRLARDRDRGRDRARRPRARDRPRETVDPFEVVYRDAAGQLRAGPRVARARAAAPRRSGATSGPRDGGPDTSVFAGRDWVKIAVPQPGFYKVDFGAGARARAVRERRQHAARQPAPLHLARLPGAARGHLLRLVRLPRGRDRDRRRRRRRASTQRRRLLLLRARAQRLGRPLRSGAPRHRVRQPSLRDPELPLPHGERPPRDPLPGRFQRIDDRGRPAPATVTVPATFRARVHVEVDSSSQYLPKPSAVPARRTSTGRRRPGSGSS